MISNEPLVKFTKHPDYKSAVTCSRCGSIWTPGTLTYGYRTEESYYSTATWDQQFWPTHLVPENECPGCRARADLPKTGASNESKEEERVL